MGDPQIVIVHHGQFDLFRLMRPADTLNHRTRVSDLSNSGSTRTVFTIKWCRIAADQ
jgi:hypothetical protein